MLDHTASATEFATDRSAWSAHMGFASAAQSAAAGVAQGGIHDLR